MHFHFLFAQDYSVKSRQTRVVYGNDRVQHTISIYKRLEFTFYCSKCLVKTGKWHRINTIKIAENIRLNCVYRKKNRKKHTTTITKSTSPLYIFSLILIRLKTVEVKIKSTILRGMLVEC